MNWEPIVALSQIGTGLATLMLAAFLAAQIILQRKSLDRAHEDAERELSLSAYALFQEHLHTRIANEPLRQIYASRDGGLDGLSKADLDAISTYFRAGYLLTNIEWRLKQRNRVLGYFIRRFDGFMDSDGGRQYYVRWGRGILNQPALLQLADEVYEKLEGRPVPDTAAKSITIVNP